MLIIGRAIAGIGGSGLMNGGLTVVATVSPVHKRPCESSAPLFRRRLSDVTLVYLGITMAFVMLGIVAGPLLGGVITQDASWRWCMLEFQLSRRHSSDYITGFYINLPIGGISATTCILTKWPSGKPTARLSLWDSFKRLDPVGFLTFAPSCIMLLLALQWGGTKYAWGSATIIGLFCGFGASLCVFIAWEHHSGDKAMIPLSMLRQRIVYSSCIVSILQMGSIQVLAFYLPVWFQVIKDASPSMSGVYFLGTIGPQIVFAILSGALSILYPHPNFQVLN
jgi:MFS family permease